MKEGWRVTPVFPTLMPAAPAGTSTMNVDNLALRVRSWNS